MAATPPAATAAAAAGGGMLARAAAAAARLPGGGRLRVEALPPPLGEFWVYAADPTPFMVGPDAPLSLVPACPVERHSCCCPRIRHLCPVAWASAAITRPLVHAGAACSAP
jgi:hypothetical protein